MKISEFSYRNLLSYGNVLQKIEFNDEPRLILVEGENGAGKSSIKEALTVSIYGRSAIRKMKDVPNWINRNAFTQIKFTTTAGEQIIISRGIDPNFSDIELNGAKFNLPDKRKVDEFVEEELVKIPFSVFCNTISLSFDDFKSFVNLSKDDKRKIVDRIFGIDILSQMRSHVKEDLKSAKQEVESLDTQIFKDSQTLENSMNQLEELRKKLSKRQESEADFTKKEIEEKKTLQEKAKLEYTELKSKIDLLQKSLDAEIEKRNSTNFSIQDLGNKLVIYEKNRCPHCLNDLTTESSIKTKEIIANKKKSLEESLPDITKKVESVKADLTKLTESQNDARYTYRDLTSDIDRLNDSLKKLTEPVKSDGIETIEEIIASIKNEISNTTSEKEQKGQQVNLFMILDELLSDSGIKATLIDKIIPTLNSRIMQISNRLDFKFSFEFNNDFDPIISYLGMQISAESLSSGQRKKMNLIVLLAFIEIIKMKHNQMNVMFLDEIFSSLDKNNVFLAIEILREYAIKYKMTIFVVSHESLPEELFDERIFVKTVNHFSEMTISKIGKA